MARILIAEDDGALRCGRGNSGAGDVVAARQDAQRAVLPGTDNNTCAFPECWRVTAQAYRGHFEGIAGLVARNTDGLRVRSPRGGAKNGWHA